MRKRLFVAATAVVSLCALTTPAEAATAWQGYAPPGGGWGLVAEDQTAVLGSPGLEVCYSYSTVGNAMVHASAKGFEFYPVPPSTQPTWNEKWYEFGAGKSGNSCVPWGEVAAKPAIKFQSISVTGTVVDVSR